MKSKLLTPIIIILFGIAWLLNSMSVIPGVDWLWTIGLAAAGIASIMVGGLTKFTIVIGPFLVIASFFSVLRQTGRLDINYEVPILIIVLGVLMIVAQLSNLPAEKSQKKRD